MMNENPEVSSLGEAERALEQQKREPIKLNTKKMRVEHREAANTLVKFIMTTPNLNVTSKKIMVKKICNPGLTNLAIAIELKIKPSDVDKYEKEGVLVCGLWLKECTSQEAIDRVNADKAIIAEVQRIRAEDAREGSKLL